MGKCVYFSYMHYGHIIPNLEMLKELSLRGEKLICYSSSTYSHLFKGFDCEFREYDNLNEIYNMFCMGYPVNAFVQDSLLQRVLATSLFFVQTLDREKAITKYYSDLLREENIDYMIYDFASFWGKSIAIELGVKSICCFEIPVFPTNIYNVDIKHFLSYFDFRYLLRDQIFLKPDRIDDDVASELKIILDAYFTLMRIKGYDDFVCMHKSDFLNIVHIPKELQAYSEELDSTYKFIGYKTPNIDNTNTEKEKCIYISQGTVFTQKHIPFVEKSINAFRESPYKVVISLGMDNRIKVIDLVIKSAQIKKSYFKKEGKISISFHGGGEPTIAFNIIKKITEYANCECNKKNIEVEYDITTNGIFSREVIMWLINNNYTIHFSMDGLKINQDMQRPTISGKSSFDIVAKNIDIAQNNSAKYTIRQTITKNNVGNIVKSIRYIIKRWKGVSSIKLAPLQQTNKSQENSIQGPNFTRYFSKIRKAIRILENNHMNTDGITGGVSSLINGGSCAATRFEQLIITPYGKITTCHEEVNSNQFIYGDVHNRVSINYKRVKELKNDDKKEIEEGYCSSCAYRMVCLGGCKHRRFSESRDFFCMLQREMYKLCILQLFRKGNLNGYFKIEKIRINEMNIELINFRQNRVK